MYRHYRIEYFRGSVHPKNKVGRTTHIKAMDQPHARQFAKMRAAMKRLIAVVTPAE